MPIITCIWVLARLPAILVGKLIPSTSETGSQEIYIKNANKIQDNLLGRYFDTTGAPSRGACPFFTSFVIDSGYL